MIYLIDDDRRGQQQEYQCSFLKTNAYQAVLQVIYKITAGSDISYFKDAKAILIHSSFPDFNVDGKVIEAQTNVYEKILALATEHQIPIVIFTNSILDQDHAKQNGNLIRLNKRYFYQNLRDFLDDHITKNRIEPKILTYGKHFVAQDLASIKARIDTAFKTSGPDYKNAALETAVREFGQTAGFADYIQKDWAAVASGTLSYNAFIIQLEKIIQSFIRYGRNIYC